MGDIVSTRRLGTFLTQLKGLFATKTEDGGKASKVTGATAGNFASLTSGGDLADSGKKASDFGSAADVAAINEKIPTQASAQNQLADKNFVNSSIQTQTAHFRGNYGSVSELPLNGDDYGGTPTNNDYMVIQDTTGKLTHEPSPWYDEAGAYVDGEIRIADDGMGVVKFYLCLADNDYDDPQPPATSPTYWEWLEDWESATSGGTWRFKYSGVWEDDGVQGWVPEYQVNEKPLTAAQIAALNSNITESLTNKLVALPAKPVDTAAQVLSAAEQAQARTNIGATAPEVFLATYGTTTFVAITAAVDAGKVVLCAYSNRVYTLVTKDAGSANFIAVNGATAYRITCEANNDWYANTFSYQQVANLVTSWQSTPDNDHYPSEKLVKDSLDAITPFIGTYNSTTFAEISAALTAGKEVWINRNGKLYQYSSGIDLEYSYYLSPDMGGTRFLQLKNATNEWAANVNTFQNVSSKVTSLSESSTNSQYPSAKCVYDNLYKPGVISQTQNWANDYGSYTLSDIVRGNIPAYFINLWNLAVMDYGTFNEATGYFELNGLTDLSYEDALRIYNIKQPGARAAREVTEWVGPTVGAIQDYPIFKIRTIIPCVLIGTEVPRMTWNIWIEVSRFIIPRNYAPIFGNIAGYTYGQHRLKRMLDTYKVESAYTLTQFYALEECHFIISANVTASDCKYLSLASVVFMVENSKNTSAIMITLHAAAYARCVADTTEYTYQGNTYTGIVAYANAKQITIASA